MGVRRAHGFNTAAALVVLLRQSSRRARLTRSGGSAEAQVLRGHKRTDGRFFSSWSFLASSCFIASCSPSIESLAICAASARDGSGCGSAA